MPESFLWIKLSEDGGLQITGTAGAGYGSRPQRIMKLLDKTVKGWKLSDIPWKEKTLSQPVCIHKLKPAMG